jgi:hypothetical protein
MGITIHYRGSLADLDRVEDFEDRVIDLALALGGDCRVWRSADERDASRIVRGVILDLASGQESTSLLISPEGWLIGLIDIEAAEKGELAEKPWCFVKTQFGPVEGHVALVELLTALKAEFMPDLEVSDEGEYWEQRVAGILQQKMSFLSRAINDLRTALESHPLSSEAAEDPDIIATRIERIASIVHKTLQRPAEHPPVEFSENEETWQFDSSENEALWDELDRNNRRRQEQITRIDGDEPLELAPAERHPLLERATALLKEFYRVSNRCASRSAALDSLLRGAMETSGGLVQALSHTDEWPVDLDTRGLSIVQLKRALRGAAFVVGSLYQLGVEKVISDEEFAKFKEEIDEIQAETVGMLKELRGNGR